VPWIQRREITRYLEAFDFSGLFTDATIGWDWPEGGASLNVPTKDGFLKLEVVAEKRGVKVLKIPPNKDGKIPPSTDRRTLEKAIRLVAAEHLLISTDAAKTQQIWQWTQHTSGKPISFREIVWQKGKANELLIQKLSSIAFTLDEEEGLDITGVVQRLSDQLNRDTVTKRFYDNFKKQKDAFAKFIEGLGDKDILAHYTSLMLNRIMFCYFLQRKGFLDGDRDYLRNRLASIQDELGEGQFHSFYRSFLRRLFHEGLGCHVESREPDFAKLIGKVPYLNGGIFDEHPIERAHPELTIPDEAFEKVFAFFDQYDWHLDERPIASGSEINPEILGYVFEKYTNQKEMGAYYTKEDITEYISKNCILPFLFNAVGKKLPDTIWELLQEDPDRYIYEAVRRGAPATLADWEASLPENIRGGLRPESLDTVVELDTPVTTLELRKDWNTPTPASHRLPTEIWRETIARHQRYYDLKEKLENGAITSIDDFITHNLDIRQFAQDVVESADASLLLAFFKALKNVSVLDPTCGSGAFLFAALEILQPLYLACLERMRVIIADWRSADESHPNWEKEIGAILDQAAAHPNEAYYINKTIIVHNLYGVDIMEEAVEICKLRLFLKLAAQLEPGQAVEPLPDIDFNVRSGNTLVGYASKTEIKKAVENDSSLIQQEDDLEQALMIGVTSDSHLYQTIIEQAEDADRAFQRFHALQEDTQTKPADFRSAKKKLNRILDILREQLDHFLAADYDLKNIKSDAKLQAWQKSHQPFHWFIEFYGIMNAGAFNVIIGNPPYVELKKLKQPPPRGYKTTESGNIYALVMERCLALGAKTSLQGFIVPVSSISTDRYSTLQEILSNKHHYYASFDDRPSGLFDGLEHIRLTIHLLSHKPQANRKNSTRYHKWYSSERETIFQTLCYASEVKTQIRWASSKASSVIEKEILTNLSKNGRPLKELTSRRADHQINYSRKVGNFLQVLDFQPSVVDGQGNSRPPSEFKSLFFEEKFEAVSALASLNSSLFYWFITLISDCRHVNKREVDAIPIPTATHAKKHFKSILPKKVKSLMDSLVETSKTKSMTFKHDELTIQCIIPKYSKSIIDQIDILLAAHYGFTEAELDFIINYDIKYRMGLGS